MKEAVLVISILISHGIKTALNYSIWNMKNPEKPAKVVTRGFSFEDTNEARRNNDSQLMFVYLGFVMFWTSFPKQKKGKVYAYLVLLLTILQVLFFFFIYLEQ